MAARVKWLGLGLLTTAVAILAYVVLVRTRPGQVVDAEVMSAILDTVPPPVGRALAALARPLIFYVLVPLVSLLTLLAVARRRWGAALAAVVMSAAPGPVCLQLREHVLTRPDLGVAGYDHNTFPSTHAGAAFGLLVALLLVWPRVPDHADVARASFVAALAMVGNVTSYAHRPADVVGSLLIVLALAWLAAGVFGVRPARPRRPRGLRRSSPR